MRETAIKRLKNVGDYFFVMCYCSWGALRFLFKEILGEFHTLKPPCYPLCFVRLINFNQINSMTAASEMPANVK